MKRLIPLLLAGILCLGLTACGNNEYDKLIEMLESGDYDSAIDYIQDLQGSLPTYGIILEGSQGSNAEADTQADAMLPLLMGQWDWNGTDPEGMPQKWIFKEDGTCYADEIQLQWKSEGLLTFIDDDIQRLRIRICAGDTTKYTILFCKRPSGELGLSCDDDGNYIVYNGCNYVRLDQYENIELTLDNWQEYFEWTESFFHETDAFGDISRRWKSFQLTLKEPYLTRMSYYGSGNCAVEISYTTNNYRVTLSNDGTTFEKGSLAPYAGYGDSYTVQRTFGYNSGTVQTWFGTEYATQYVWEPSAYQEIGTGYYCVYAEQQQVTRIQGTLRILKNN